MDTMPLEREVPLLHKTGLHLRAAGRFAETANQFEAEVMLATGGRVVNGKSVLDILTLGAGPGVQLMITADGDDAQNALDQLESLVRDNFGED
jgi:phosphocarrier protein HPr